MKTGAPESSVPLPEKIQQAIEEGKSRVDSLNADVSRLSRSYQTAQADAARLAAHVDYLKREIEKGEIGHKTVLANVASAEASYSAIEKELMEAANALANAKNEERQALENAAKANADAKSTQENSLRLLSEAAKVQKDAARVLEEAKSKRAKLEDALKDI